MTTPLPTARARDLEARIDALEGVLPLRPTDMKTLAAHIPAVRNQTTFTVQEAAEILGYHPETVRRMIRDGRLKAARGAGGRGSVISRADLEAFYRAQGGGDLFEKTAV